MAASGDGYTGGAVETMRKEDAMQFPLVGSVALFSLYCAFKYLDKDWVNFLIGIYFSAVGALAVTASLAPVVAMIVRPSSVDEKLKVEKKYSYSHSLPEFLVGPSPFELSIDLNFSRVMAFVLSVLFSVYYFQTRYWAANNILGISFCLQGIERFSLGSYKIGAILLIGLFFYDIFWVFGTDVMVTVAKSLDGPIKILFPRSLSIDEVTGKHNDLSLLGLGDIVIPGFFIALMLRFDAENAKIPPTPTDMHASFPKPYFHSCLVGYILGLATTLFIMIYFNHAQPALLYLVPACLGSTLLCGAVRGEFKAMFAYSEEEEDEEAKDGSADTKKEEVAKKED